MSVTDSLPLAREESYRADDSEQVPVAPFRERYLRLERDGLSGYDVARWLGWVNCGRPDNSRVLRTLGLRPQCSHGKQYWQRTIRYELAVQLCDVLGLDYHEAGV